MSGIDVDEYRELELAAAAGAATPSRRTTLGREEGSAIPVPSSGIPRRQSGGVAAGVPKTPGKRTSSGVLREGDREARELERKKSEVSLAGGGAMKPPARRKLSGVGECY